MLQVVAFAANCEVQVRAVFEASESCVRAMGFVYKLWVRARRSRGFLSIAVEHVLAGNKWGLISYIFSYFDEDRLARRWSNEMVGSNLG